MLKLVLVCRLRSPSFIAFYYKERTTRYHRQSFWVRDLNFQNRIFVLSAQHLILPIIFNFILLATVFPDEGCSAAPTPPCQPNQPKITSSLLNDCLKTIEYFRLWSQNNFLFFSFSKESKIYCISESLLKGRNSAKMDCLSTKNVTRFRILELLSKVPTTNDQYLLKEQR